MPDDPKLDPSQVPGFWLGLAMMATVFCREHNAICDALKAAYPDYGDEELFQRARLVISAFLAKIHTAEWTPAIISHPTTVTALRANWFGLLGERVHRAFGFVGNEVLNGIPGSGVDHFGVPYSLTSPAASARSTARRWWARFAPSLPGSRFPAGRSWPTPSPTSVWRQPIGGRGCSAR